MTTCESNYDAIQNLVTNARHEEAIAALEQIISGSSDRAPAHFDLGNLYYAEGQMDKARHHYEKAVALIPGRTVYLKHLAGLVYTEYKDVRKALNLYQEVLAVCPEDVDVLLITGHLCVELERFGSALGYYNRILEIEPLNKDARRLVDRMLAHGIVLTAEKGPEAGFQWCKELACRGQVADALDGLETLVADHPDFSLAYNDLGVLYYRIGDKKRSLDCFEKAVALEPENANYRKNLADYYLAELGEIEKALEIYMSVLKDNPKDIDALTVAGKINAALGNSRSARTFYDRALAIEPWNMEVSDQLVRLSGPAV